MSVITDEQLEHIRAKGEFNRGFNVRRIIARDAHPVVVAKVRAVREPIPGMIRPCPKCQTLTRPASRSAANNPGTRPRGADDVCTKCLARVKRTGKPRVLSPALDVPAAVAAYRSGVSASAIARQTGVYIRTVVKQLTAAGVVMRNASQAALLREAS